MDVNGDGKMDLVRRGRSGGNATASVWRSNGTGFTNVSTTTIGGWCTTQTGGDCAIAELPMDVNGDGKMDLVRRGRSGSNATASVWLSNGTGFTNVSSVSVGSWSISGDTAIAELPMDVNGDGKKDLVRRWHNGANAWALVYLSSGPAPDRLNLLPTGVGGATMVSYQPSTQYINTQLPYPVQTVSAMTSCDNWNGTSCVGLSSTTSYAYDGGFHNLEYRDFRGFEHVVVTGPTGPNGEWTKTETWFHQGTNLSAADDTLTDLQTAPVAYAAGLPWKTEVTDQAGTLLTWSRTRYINVLGSTTAPFLRKVLSTRAFTCQGVGSCTKDVLSEFQYNSMGGLTHEWLSGDVSTASDNRTVIHTLSSNTTDWILNVPIKDEVYRGVAAYGDTPVLMAQTDSYYDGTTSCATASTNQVPTKGRLTRTVRSYFNGTSSHASPEARMAYDSYGNVVCTRDANGNTSTVTYDSATNTFPLTSTTASPASLTTSTSYYGVNGVAIPATGFYGQVQGVTDPNGRVITHEYDALGRRTKTTNPDGFFVTTTYNYGAGQTVGTQHVLTTNSLGHSSVSYFDGLGRGIRKTSTYTAGPTREVKTEYNGRGQVMRTSLPYFTGGTVYWRTMAYDALGRVTQVTNPDNTTSKSCYSNWTTVTIEPDGTRTRTTKDVAGRVVKVEEYNTTFASCDTSVGTPYTTTTYAYDVLGNLLAVTDAKGNVSTMVYDSLSRKKSMHDPDIGDWSYLYDANGNLTKQTDAKGQVLWFTYDTLNRRVQKDLGGTAPKALGSGDVRYIYDDTVTTTNRKGRLKQMVDAATNVTFEYDVMGRVSKSTKVLDGMTYVTTSAYDGLGRLTSVTYPSTPAKSVDYVYEGPYLKQVKDKPTDGTVTYVQYAGWNESGQSGTATYNVGTNQVTTTYTYQVASNATCGSKQTFRPCTTKVQKGTNPAYLDLRYAFTNGGNVNDIYDQVTPANDQHFIYDALDRLTNANGPFGAGGINTTLTHAYDEIGNMTLNGYVGGTNYTYPASGSTSVRPHAVSTAGPNTYAYDNNGNMTSGAGRIFEWNLENKPTCIAQAAGTCSAATNKTTFVYDGAGGRLKKSTSTTTTRYISKLYECDTTGANTSCSRFIWAGNTRVATVASNGTMHFWHQDHLGSSTVITDSTGAKVQALAYFPYGATRTNQSFTTPAVDVPYKYTGQELDSTGLYYYEARYYDPVIGRFISPDTIVPDLLDPQSLNRYSYVYNNPLRYTDPTGHCPWCIWIAIGVGVTAGSVSSGIQSDWDLKATLVGGVIGGVSAAVGYGVFEPAMAAFASFGPIGSGIAGGIVAGAAGGYTSAILANMAGYNVDIGLAIASGAAAGAIAGGAFGFGAGFDLGGLAAAMSAPAAGAAGAAISGADPGMGAAIAAATAAFSYGVSSAYKAIQEYRASLAVDMQASSSTDRILLAQQGPVRQTPMGRALHTMSDLMDEAAQSQQGAKKLNQLGTVMRETENLEFQLPQGQIQKGHIFFDRVTGKHGGSVIGDVIYGSQSEDYSVILHGRGPRPSLK